MEERTVRQNNAEIPNRRSLTPVGGVLGSMRFFEYPSLPYDYYHSHKEKVAALTRVIMDAVQTFQRGSGQIYLRGRIDHRSQMGVLGYLRANHGINFSSRLIFDDKAILPQAQTIGTLIHIRTKGK